MVKAGTAGGVGVAIDAPQAPPSAWQRLWRVFEILTVFVGIGPPVGAVALAAVTTAYVLCFESHRVTDVIAGGAGMMGFGMVVSYVIGGIPAGMAGALVGIKQIYFGGASRRFALAIGVLSGFWVVAYNGKLPLTGDTWKAVAVFCVVTTSATFVCWRIVRFWYLHGPSDSRGAR